MPKETNVKYTMRDWIGLIMARNKEYEELVWIGRSDIDDTKTVGLMRREREYGLVMKIRHGEDLVYLHSSYIKRSRNNESKGTVR